MKINNKKGICYWITGLSGAGKSTIAQELLKLMKKNHKNVVLLDGDNLRKIFKNNSFNETDRLNLSYQYASMVNLLLDQGIHVVAAFMALFSEIHLWNRKNITNYVEVFLDIPTNELERRDPKGLYKKYRLGEIKNMAGLDLKADMPIHPDYHFKWEENKTSSQIANKLFEDFKKRVN